MEHSLIDALLDHGGEQRDHAAHGQPAELFTDDRVAVGVPDLDDGEDQVFLFRLAAGNTREERLQLAQRRHVRVIQERRQVRDGPVGEPVDDRLEQRLLRIEVVVKGALGGFELVQDVLDAHRLVPFRLDEALGHVQKRVATDHMTRGIHGPGHACTISDRRSVYLWLSVRQGAPKQYAVRPVGAGGAERQQVPGVAGVWQDVHRHEATTARPSARTTRITRWPNGAGVYRTIAIGAATRLPASTVHTSMPARRSETRMGPWGVAIRVVAARQIGQPPRPGNWVGSWLSSEMTP